MKNMSEDVNIDINFQNKFVSSVIARSTSEINTMNYELRHG